MAGKETLSTFYLGMFARTEITGKLVNRKKECVLLKCSKKFLEKKTNLSLYFQRYLGLGHNWGQDVTVELKQKKLKEIYHIWDHNGEESKIYIIHNLLYNKLKRKQMNTMKVVTTNWLCDYKTTAGHFVKHKLEPKTKSISFLI